MKASANSMEIFILFVNSKPGNPENLWVPNFSDIPDFFDIS